AGAGATASTGCLQGDFIRAEIYSDPARLGAPAPEPAIPSEATSEWKGQLWTLMHEMGHSFGLDHRNHTVICPDLNTNYDFGFDANPDSIMVGYARDLQPMPRIF